MYTFRNLEFDFENGVFTSKTSPIFDKLKKYSGNKPFPETEKLYRNKNL